MTPQRALYQHFGGTRYSHEGFCVAERRRQKLGTFRIIRMLSHLIYKRIAQYIRDHSLSHVQLGLTITYIWIPIYLFIYLQ